MCDTQMINLQTQNTMLLCKSTDMTSSARSLMLKFWISSKVATMRAVSVHVGKRAAACCAPSCKDWRRAGSVSKRRSASANA